MKEYRKYQSQPYSKFRIIIYRTEFPERNMYVTDIKTTGPDPKIDRITNINIIKCRFWNHLLEPVEEFSFSDKDSDRSFTDVMRDLNSFLRTEATICGFDTLPRIAPFLVEAMIRTGVRLNILYMFDLFTVAKTSIPPMRLPNGSMGYSTKLITSKLGEKDDIHGHMQVYNKLYEQLPLGISPVERGFVKGTTFVDKERHPELIRFKTSSGPVLFNCDTLYFEECMPGYFDVIDMDSFTRFVLKVTKSNNLLEFSKKLQKATH